MIKMILGLTSVDALRARAGKGPVLFGALPSMRPETVRPLSGWFEYNDLHMPFPFTGGLLLTDDFINNFYEHMGFHEIWKFRHVREVLFQEGQIVADHDRSELMAHIRQRLRVKHNPGASSPSSSHEQGGSIDRKEMDAWMAECLTHKYFVPAAFPTPEGREAGTLRRKYEPRKEWTFAEALMLGTWEPIPNCPGRHVLRGASESMSLSKLLGPGVDVMEYHPSEQRDRVFVARLTDGGIISYLRSSGGWVHTLGNSEGFARKLNQLGIRQTDSRPKGDDEVVSKT